MLRGVHSRLLRLAIERLLWRRVRVGEGLVRWLTARIWVHSGAWSVGDS